MMHAQFSRQLRLVRALQRRLTKVDDIVIACISQTLTTRTALPPAGVPITSLARLT